MTDLSSILKDGANVDMPGLRNFLTTMQSSVNALVANQGVGSLVYATWDELSATSTDGLTDGAGARVYQDDGTHDDPISGETVDNEGVYRWHAADPSGWERVANLEAADAAAAATISKDWATSDAEPDPENAPGDQSAKTYAVRVQVTYEAFTPVARHLRGMSNQALDRASFGQPESLSLGGKMLRQVSEDGQHFLPGGIKTTIPEAQPERVYRPFRFAYTLDRGGTAVTPLALDWDDKIFAALNDDTMAAIRSYLAASGGIGGGFMQLDELRGDYGAYPVRIWPIADLADFIVAQVQDRGGQTYRAFERKAGSTSLAMIEGPAIMEGAFDLGQSTAGKSGDSVSLDRVAHFPASVISFAGTNQFYGDADLSASVGAADLAPLANLNADGQLPMVTRELALAQFRCDFGIAQTGTMTGTCWRGSTALVDLDKGGSTFNYVNSLAMFTDAHAMVQDYQRSGIVVKRLHLSQGENSSADGWDTDFAAYKGHYLEDIPPITGQADDPQFFIRQTNTIFGAHNNNWIAQNAVHDSGAAIMTSSAINLPLAADDHIHPTAIGIMIGGDQDAHAVACWERDGYWSLPRVADAATDFELSGTTLTVWVEIPRDTISFGKVLDKLAPPQVAQDGWFLTDGSTTIAITDIDYSIDTDGRGKVVMTLASAPGAGYILRYGDDNETDYPVGDPTDPPVWACRTGNVFCTTGHPSFWHRAGYDVPAFIRHPLRRERIEIS